MPFWSSQRDVTQRPPLLLPAPALVPTAMPARGSARAVHAAPRAHPSPLVSDYSKISDQKTLRFEPVRPEC